MDPSMELFDASKCSSSASLVHLSYEVEATHKDIFVSLGLLFENTTSRPLENAVFSVRLPDGATVSLVECEVEKPGGMILGAPEIRLQGRYCVNTLADGPFFRCEIGRVDVERDVVIFLKYNFRPLVEGNVIHMSLPLPGTQTISDDVRHRTGITLESKYPMKIVKVTSSSHKIRPRFVARKARIAVSDPFGQGDLEMAIMAIDTSRYLPSAKIMENDQQCASSTTVKKARRSAIPPKRPMETEYAPMSIFEEYCTSEDMPWMQQSKPLPQSRYSMPVYCSSSSSTAPSLNSSSGSSFAMSTPSFFLSDSDSDSIYELQEDEDERNSTSEEEITPTNTEKESDAVVDNGLGWFDFSSLSSQSRQSSEMTYPTKSENKKCNVDAEVQISGPTSWLIDETCDGDDEYLYGEDDDEDCLEDYYGGIFGSRRDGGVAFATVAIIINPLEKPRIVDIRPTSSQSRQNSTTRPNSSTPSKAHPQTLPRIDTTAHRKPLTPPTTPKSRHAILEKSADGVGIKAPKPTKRVVDTTAMAERLRCGWRDAVVEADVEKWLLQYGMAGTPAQNSEKDINSGGQDRLTPPDTPLVDNGGEDGYVEVELDGRADGGVQRTCGLPHWCGVI